MFASDRPFPFALVLAWYRVGGHVGAMISFFIEPSPIHGIDEPSDCDDTAGNWERGGFVRR